MKYRFFKQAGEATFIAASIFFSYKRLMYLATTRAEQIAKIEDSELRELAKEELRYRLGKGQPPID